MTESLSPEFLTLQAAVAGRYSLVRELGRGGMGVVFLAREVSLDRLVAIKLLPPRFSTDQTVCERFLREARTAARLAPHPERSEGSRSAAMRFLAALGTRDEVSYLVSRISYLVSRH